MLLMCRNAKVVNLIPGDFNGDSVIDLLVSIQNGQEIDLKLMKGSKSRAHENNLGYFSNFIMVELSLIF